jgi:hypothetical protein
MHSQQAINSDLNVLIVCNKTGGTIKGDIKKEHYHELLLITPNRETQCQREQPSLFLFCIICNSLVFTRRQIN